MLTLDGIPLHPLIVHVVVVLLPLAAVGAVLVAVRPAWRRTFGVPVLIIALIGVTSVPIATQTGEQLKDALPGPNPLIELHEQRGETLLPVAVAFLVLLAVAVVAGLRADRIAAAAAGTAGTGTAPVGAAATRSVVATGAAVDTLTRIATAAGLLAAVAGLVVTGLVIWIGHAGATAVWQGVGS